VTDDVKHEREAHQCPSCDLSPPLEYKHKVLRRIELRQPQTDALKKAREAFERMPEPYEYLTKDQLKDIRPYMDALHNWKHRYVTPFME